MIRSKLFAVLVIFYALATGSAKAQSPAVDIVISEYQATNETGPTDFYGQHSDWVELQSTFSSSVSLASYYLSNDRYNLFKWKFPNNFTLKTNEVKVVWLTGRNVQLAGGEVHANFTLDQCKGQWLLLTTDKGVVRDSILIRPTMRDHTRGRISNKSVGYDEWRVFTTHSFLQPNSTLNYYKDYAPTPEIYVSNDTSFRKPNKGGFYTGSKVCYIRLQGTKYDTTTHKCFNVFYTLSQAGDNSDVPVPGYPPVAPSMQYVDKLNSPFTIDASTVVRAIAVHNPTVFGCDERYLPSFIETNTYFIDPNVQSLKTDKNFGVLSLAFDKQDTSWFADLSTRTIHVEYYEQGKQLCEGYGILTKPPMEKWETKQKGFYITMDDRLGFGCGFEGQLFNIEGLGISTRTMFPTIHVYGGDHESHSAYLKSPNNESFGTGLRDVFMQSIAAKNKLNVSPLHVKPIVAVKEGKYYGVFTIKEVYDKDYEQFYYGQGPDSLTLNFVQGGVESHVTYWDKTVSKFAPKAWRAEVYDYALGGNPLTSKQNYDQLMSVLDQNSLIDYMILNSYAVNTGLFQYDVALAKGGDPTKPGGKWHFYLWNAPSVFSFTNVPLPSQSTDFNMGRSPCYYYLRTPDFIPPANTGNLAFSGIGNVFRKLMTTTDNSGATVGQFQQAFRNRYMDLLNGPLSCEELRKQWKYLRDLYTAEMKKHEDPGISKFGTTVDTWKKNMNGVDTTITARCFFHEDNRKPVFNTYNCFGITGPYNITVDVKPEGAGKVILNSTLLEEYKWEGKYYNTKLSFKAIPTSTAFAFHHWEFRTHATDRPTTMDSVSIDFAMPEGDDVVAVFTDKTRPITAGSEGATIPTGFTPNGDGLNEIFRPLGAAVYATNYEMLVFNRWGQEVFRSTNPGTGWDGYFKGQQAITGVYAYIISYRNYKNEDIQVRGNVTLTR